MIFKRKRHKVLHQILNSDLAMEKGVVSEKCLLIPGKIAGKAVTIKTDVVNSEISLLLSNYEM